VQLFRDTLAQHPDTGAAGIAGLNRLYLRQEALQVALAARLVQPVFDPLQL